MARKVWNARPGLEDLETRQLLSGGRIIGPDGNPINDKDLLRWQVAKQNLQSGSTATDRTLRYTTPEGARVSIRLYGLGTLQGSTVDAATGGLKLVYDGTNASSKILGLVTGGPRRAPLLSMTDADLDPESSSGVGTNQVLSVKLDRFDLVDGGRVNLSGGVQTLSLRTIGRNTVIDARSLPLTSDQENPSPTSPVPILNFVSINGSLELAGVGGLTVPGAAGVSGATAGTTGAVTTRIGPGGQVELIPTTNATGEENIVVPGPGVNLFVQEINGAPREIPLANPQVYGYDPAAQQLVRFDARTGAVLGAITGVPNGGQAESGVGIGRIGTQQVVLVGTGQTVYVFDVLTNTPVGSFSVANVANIDHVTGLGSTEQGTAITYLGTDGVIRARAFDIEQSLRAGTAALVGSTFTPSREFDLTGGLTGAAGLSIAFFTGEAYFDTFQPNTQLPGTLIVNTANGISESSRVQGIPQLDSYAFGSIDTNPALVTGIRTVTDPDTGATLPFSNTVQIYNANNMSAVAQLQLLYPNLLTGLSESVHPELTNGSIINVGGILNRLHVKGQMTGTVVNTVGYLANIDVNVAMDSAFVGLPIGHVNIRARQNVQLYSTTGREVGDRGGVILVNPLRPVGPLSPPR
jgi:hypothetical protein